MADIKISQLNDEQATKMVDLKSEATKINSSEFSAYTSLRGGGNCLWTQADQ